MVRQYNPACILLVSRIFPRPFSARKSMFETRKILGRVICQRIQ
jgi:hypothetical protein